MEGEIGPEEQVLSSPELIDNIFSFLDLQTVGRARQVSRKWRNVSDLYLKRHTTIKCSDFVFFITSRLEMKKEAQEQNLLNTSVVNEPIGELKLSRKSPPFPYVEKPEPFPAPTVAFMLEVKWPNCLRFLTLDKCLTYDSWISFGMVILHRMKTVSSVFVELWEDDTNQVLPLCFQELKDQLKDEKLQNERLGKFEITTPSDLFSHEREGRVDAIVLDVFATCPNLKGFLLHARQTKAELKRVNDVGSNGVSVWEAEIESIPVFPEILRTFNPLVVRISCAILKAVPVRKLSIPLTPEVSSRFESEPSLLDGLKTLVLTNLGMRSSLMECLTSATTAFKNVKSLELNARLLKESKLELENFRVESIFPSLITLQLVRVWQYVGFGIDEWILSNVQKMAPNLKRLMVDVFHPEVGAYQGNPEERLYQGDYQKVLYLAKSFNQLKHLVLFNYQPWNIQLSESTLMNMDEVSSCLEGLTAITLFVVSPEVLSVYTKVFLKACKERTLLSIREMKLYRKLADDEEAITEFIDSKQLGFAIPEHVRVTVGRWTDGVQIENDLLEGPVD